MLRRSSERILAFICDLCGLTEPWQRWQLQRVVFSLGRERPHCEDDAVQGMALEAWTAHLQGRKVTTGTLIAAGNRAAADGRR